MRVICIDVSKIKPCRCGSVETNLTEGGSFNAEQCKLSINSLDIKESSGCPNCGVLWSYRKTRFIELSNIDETESEVYKNLQTVSV